MTLSKMLKSYAKKTPPQVRIPADPDKVLSLDTVDKISALTALIQKTEAQQKKRNTRLQSLLRAQTVFCPGCAKSSKVSEYTFVKQVKWSALEGEYESRSRNFICCPCCGTHLILRGPSLGLLNQNPWVLFVTSTNTSIHPVTTYFEHIGDEYRQFELSEYS